MGIRIMLLGPGDSGKTTILKQMKKINNQCEQNEINSITPYIRGSVVSYMKILCQQSVLINPKVSENTLVDPKLEEFRTKITLLKTPTTNSTIHNSKALSPDVAKAIRILWKDDGIRNTLKNRVLFQIHDNVSYFLDSVDRIADPQFKPTWKDYVRIRMRSAGFSQTKLTTQVEHLGEHTFEFIDVGGQRSERAKWMRFVSEDINTVCYVIALSEYDLVLMEDSSVNRIQEAINLFEEIMTKGKFFANKSVFLFFNKFDLFVEKIRRVPITVAFPDFPVDEMDPHDEDDVIRFVSNKFLDVLGNHKITLNGPLLVLRTTALDSDNIHKVFSGIMLNVVKSMMECGIL